MNNRIEEIRARAEEATPAPWGTPERPLFSILEIGYNAGFVVNAREDIPYLLSEIDRLTAELVVLQTREKAAVNLIDFLEMDAAHGAPPRKSIDRIEEWRGVKKEDHNANN